jgi:excisionase family DNA binding protein
MNFTLSQAAKATGKSKSSISRAIDTGRLSATRNGGLFEINAAELHRVFPLKVDANGVPLNESKNVPRNNLDAPRTGINFSALEREVELLRERLGEKDAQILDMRSERDRLLKVIEEQATSMRRLTDLRPPDRQPEQAARSTGKPAQGDERDRWRPSATERRGWWPFRRPFRRRA